MLHHELQEIQMRVPEIVVVLLVLEGLQVSMPLHEELILLIGGSLLLDEFDSFVGPVNESAVEVHEHKDRREAL